MNIGFVTSLYPSKSRPNYGTFVQQLVWEMARQGEKCTVVAPTSLFALRYGPLNPTHELERVDTDSTVEVFRPRFLSASAKQIWRYNTNELSYRGFRRAAERRLKKIASEVDILYGHFLFPSGRVVASIGPEIGKPGFAAHGDDCIEGPNLRRGGRDFKDLTGIIAVSERNKKFCQSHLRFPSERIAVFPNGVDHKSFFPRNKADMRKKFGLPLDKNLVVFVGHFIERKGPHRVLEAIEPLEDVRAVMVGAGPVRVEGPQIVFKKPVANSQVPELLSACDIFVLPTLNEGCCNAILEALSCGLPVVTSRGDFNDEIVNEGVAIRVDPLDIGEIRAAVVALVSNPAVRREMSRRALEHAVQFSIGGRAKGIVKGMRGILEGARRNS